MLHGDGVTGCHGFVTANPKAAAEEGWHVKPWEEPAEIPALYRGRMALLSNDGRIEYQK